MDGAPRHRRDRHCHTPKLRQDHQPRLTNHGKLVMSSACQNQCSNPTGANQRVRLIDVHDHLEEGLAVVQPDGMVRLQQMAKSPTGLIVDPTF